MGEEKASERTATYQVFCGGKKRQMAYERIHFMMLPIMPSLK